MVHLSRIGKNKLLVGCLGHSNTGINRRKLHTRILKILLKDKLYRRLIGKGRIQGVATALLELGVTGVWGIERIDRPY